MPNRSVDDNWRPKHEAKWAGPFIVTELETATIYEVRELSTGRFFRRHISNITAYPGRIILDTEVKSLPSSSSVPDNFVCKRMQQVKFKMLMICLQLIH